MIFQIFSMRFYLNNLLLVKLSHEIVYGSKEQSIVGIDLSTLFGERKFFSYGIQSSCEKGRSNLRINLIVWERRTSKKVVGIPHETEKIELSFSQSEFGGRYR